jgi:hypothetical protein
MGLLGRGARVELVEDAIQSLDEQAHMKMLAEFTGAGGTVTSTNRVLAG